MKVIYTLIALKCALHERRKLNQNKFSTLFPPLLFYSDDKHHNLIVKAQQTQYHEINERETESSEKKLFMKSFADILISMCCWYENV